MAVISLPRAPFRLSPARTRRALALFAEELTAAEPGSAHWFAEAPGDLAPVLGLVDGAESGLERAAVLSRLTRHLQTAPVAWDPYAPVG